MAPSPRAEPLCKRTAARPDDRFTGDRRPGVGHSSGRAGPRPGHGPALALAVVAIALNVAGRLPPPFPAVSSPRPYPAANDRPPESPAGRTRPVPPPDLSRVTGVIEPIPQNVYRASPYNGWPLFELHVREGQRLRFRREGGRWVGDSTALFTQLETPSEIDGLKEEVEVAALEARSAGLAVEILRDELGKGLEAAEVRERNARQLLDRLDRLRGRTPADQAEHDRARNALALARSQREEAASLLGRKVEAARVGAELAEHRRRRAESGLQLADFKREMSWGRVPVAAGRFEEVVVTRVSGARGDVPAASGRRDAWVEVVDDRRLQARCLVEPELVGRLRSGVSAAVRQAERAYGGVVTSVGALAEAGSGRVPVLVEVSNEGRALSISTKVTVDFTVAQGPAR
jgi:hypothetical protein